MRLMMTGVLGMGSRDMMLRFEYQKRKREEEIAQRFKERIEEINKRYSVYERKP